MDKHSQPLGSLSAALQERFDAMGERWADDINAHRDLVVQAYTPLVSAADNRGIAVAADIPYGSHARQVLDVYSRPQWSFQVGSFQGGSGQDGQGQSGPAQAATRDVLLFFHGGAFIRGNKSSNGAVYDNVAYWFARHDCVALNVEYRLAPESPYPGGAEDVIAAVRWVQRHIHNFGGNTARIFLMGHSAGGAHVASALFDPAIPGRLSEAEIAGVMLVSARLRADVLPDNPNAAGVRAYFGEDEDLYEARSPASHAGASNVPALIAVAQYENPHLDRYGLAFFNAAQASGRSALTRYLRLPRHNHTSIVAHLNSGEETLGPELLRFMRDVR